MSTAEWNAVSITAREDVPHAPSPAERALSNLRDELGSVSSAVGLLAKRLNPILSPHGPELVAQDCEMKAEQSAGQHVSSLRDLTAEVRTIDAALSGLLNRLDI